MMYFIKINIFFISFIFLSSTSFCMRRINRETPTSQQEDDNSNLIYDTNQKENNIIKDDEAKLTQLVGIYSSLHNILVNLGFNEDYTECYYIVEEKGKNEDFFEKIIKEVITPLERFIKENKDYMKVNCIFEPIECHGNKSNALIMINRVIKCFMDTYGKPGKERKNKTLQIVTILDSLMRMGCYIMDVLIVRYNAIYNYNQIDKKRVGKFSDGFKPLLKDVKFFVDVKNHYKDLVSDLMKLCSFVSDFDKQIGENYNDSDVFSDKNFEYVSNLVFNVFRNVYDVFLFGAKFNSLDLIVEEMTNNIYKEDHIKNIFFFTYKISVFCSTFLRTFFSKKRDEAIIRHRFFPCLKCLLALLCNDVKYFIEGHLSEEIEENVGRLRQGVNYIGENFLYSISFDKFIGNCRSLLEGGVSLNVELEGQMGNLDTEIIEDNDVMSISDYSSIPRVKVPLKEIVDNNRSGDCVSCRSKVQITDINNID